MNNIRIILIRELKLKTRWKPFMISLVFPPLIYLIFVGTGFSKNFSFIFYKGINISYLTFLIPGIIVMQIFNIFGYCGSMVSNEVKWGIYKLFKLYNVKKWEYLIGKMISESIILFLQVIGIILVGGIINPDFLRFLRLTKLFLLILFIFISLTLIVSLGIIFGFLFPDEQKRSFFFSLFTLPLMFCSSIFYPMEKLPLWFKIPAYINPLTHLSNGIRDLLIIGIDLVFFKAIIIIIIFSILSFFVCMKIMEVK
ncbi:MAG: ABC transporter permease [candidate division WOR-3 bacterium]